MPAQVVLRFRIGRIALAAMLLSLSSSAFAASPPRPAEPLYPTDRCVARKLAAAADACEDLILAQGERDPRKFAERVRDVTQDLARTWQKAEADSLAAGVDCVQTTVTSTQMETLLEDGAKGLAASLATASEKSEKSRGHRDDLRRLDAVGEACFGLILAESRHLLDRFHDRNTRELERDRRRALDGLEDSFDKDDGTKASFESVRKGVKALAQGAIDAAIVSPNVSTSWTMVSPDTQVPYLGKILEPICSGGTPWVYFVKRGTVNKLFVYYEGGGACWDYPTCGFFKSFKQTAGPEDNPANVTTGFGDASNPENPFRDWNAVMVPYCTGDIHWGDSTVVYTSGAASVTIQHKGFVNAQVAEKFSREHFVDPEEVFVAGSSAGAYGAILNSVYFEERVYPASRFATLGDADNGIITQDFLQNDFSKWGVEATLPPWIPGFTFSKLDPTILWSAPALFYPENRFANYASAYDGGVGGQTGFYNIMLNPTQIFQWPNWWNATCAWHDGMEQQVQAAAAAAPNYRYYVGTGSMHTMWGSNKVYTDTSGGVPLLVDWVTAMRDGTTAWTNVQCTDCGVLLPGDPRPVPAQPPFTPDDSRVDCSLTPSP
ncbi:MAG TPA: pectin acetylesterase-family hydrolase [Myxococcota bacterium]|nr:pectin acetylesterase-family hydrolase [Myxococcota bacterium]